MILHELNGKPTPTVIKKIHGHSERCSHVEEVKVKKKKKIINKSVSTFSHISTNTQPIEHMHSHMHSHSPAHPLAHTNPCSIDNITYFLPTVIWLRNCLQSVSPGNSWPSSALFSTPNKDSFLIGPLLPLLDFHTNQIFVYRYTQ